MNILTLFLEETQTGATIEIIILLLGAGIIAYVIAWLYYKSIYKKIIENLEAENHELKAKIEGLKADNNNLQESLQEKDNEIKALKASNAEAVHEADDMKSKNKRTEQLLHEKDEALNHIAQRKHLLDYNSFGKASETEKDDLKMISGIGPFIEERLHALDIYTFRQISNFTKRDIETINVAIEYFAGRIERDEWVAQARELANKEEREAVLDRIRSRKTNIYFDRIGIANKNKADDLTAISGIGGWIEKKLNMLDIYTFKQIANFNKEDIEMVTKSMEYFPGRIERDEWVHQAKDLVRREGKKANLMNKIMRKKDVISASSLGQSLKHQANNLTLIKGITLWIEERLNLLDIYTFEQISKLSPKDVKTISEILEISPERIQEDRWIDQGKKFTDMKVSSPQK